MSLTRKQADALYQVIDAAIQENWPAIASTLVERGYTAEEVCDAGRALAEMCDCTPLFEKGDF